MVADRSPLRGITTWGRRRTRTGERVPVLSETQVRVGAELLGGTSLVIAAFLVGAALGFLVLGIVLIIAANFAGGG